MALKIKFKGNHATARWNHPMEKEFFKMKMIELRDSDPKSHPPMYVKDEGNKEIQRPKPPTQMVKQTVPILVNPKEVSVLEENKQNSGEKKAAQS